MRMERIHKTSRGNYRITWELDTDEHDTSDFRIFSPDNQVIFEHDDENLARNFLKKLN